MRYAILGDVHANYEALTAVLAALEKLGVDEYYCVGDVVGYGADPGPCLERLREIGCVVVAGNHDHAAIGKTSIEYFNPEAKLAALWTRDHLTEEEKAFLGERDLVHEAAEFMVVHATLHGPEMFTYILNHFDALLCLQHLTRPVCFVGHSHVPLTFLETDRISVSFEPRTQLTDGHRAIVNVGSVGQPRDQDPKAAFAVYDTRTRAIDVTRVEYEIEKAARKILDAGLPPMNASRIKLGQ